MRITVLHNPRAGDDEHTRDEIEEALEEAGHDIRYFSTRKGKLRKALERDADLILIAGGDGTVKKVATRLGPDSPPIAILPCGTANNVAKALRSLSGLQEVVEGLARATQRRLDVGIARADFGERRFIEAMGGGVFARIIRSGSRAEDASPYLPGNSMDRALRIFARELEVAMPRPWGMWVDGRDVSGEYLMVEVMNMRLLGPNLPLACTADPGDGLFDVVAITPDQRHELLSYLEARIGGDDVTLELESAPGREVELEVHGEFLHVDDAPWPESEDPDEEDEEDERGVRMERRGRTAPGEVSGRISIAMAPGGVNVRVVTPGSNGRHAPDGSGTG